MRTLTIYLLAVTFLVLGAGAASASTAGFTAGGGEMQLSIQAGGSLLQSELVNLSDQAAVTAGAIDIVLDEPVAGTTSALLVGFGLLGIGLAGSRKRRHSERTLRAVSPQPESAPTPLVPALERIRAVALVASRLE